MSESSVTDGIRDYDYYQSQLQSSPACHSLLKSCLTREIFNIVKHKQTAYGGDFALLVRSGLANPDSSIGVYAPDAEAYQTFSPLLDTILSSYHGINLGFKQPLLYFGNPKDLRDLDPQKKYVVSTRIRCARSLSEYPFNSLLTNDQYRAIEKKVVNAIQTFPAELQGTYRTLASMSAEEKDELIKSHFLFKEGDRFLEAANASRFWPDGRGIFYNDDKTILLWVNEEDHLRIISMEGGGDISRVYARFINVVETLSSKLDFAHSETHGYLTFCPTNIGTTIRASVHIRLPKLGHNMQKLDALAKKYNLQIRGTHGEHSAVDDNLLDISNKSRFGVTEFDAVRSLHDGVLELIQIEESS